MKMYICVYIYINREGGKETRGIESKRGRAREMDDEGGETFHVGERSALMSVMKRGPSPARLRRTVFLYKMKYRYVSRVHARPYLGTKYSAECINKVGAGLSAILHKLSAGISIRAAAPVNDRLRITVR